MLQPTCDDWQERGVVFLPRGVMSSGLALELATRPVLHQSNITKAAQDVSELYTRWRGIKLTCNGASCDVGGTACIAIGACRWSGRVARKGQKLRERGVAGCVCEREGD